MTEQVFRPHPRVALERFLLALGGVAVFTFPIAVATIINDDGPRASNWLLAELNLVFTLIVPILVSLVPVVQVLFTRYTMDDEGLREQVQILSKTERRVPWEKVTALQHRRTLLDRLLGLERIDVIAYGERGTTIHLVGLTSAAALRDRVALEMRRNASVARLFSND